MCSWELSWANQSQVSVYTIYIPSVNTLQTHLFANNVVIISLWKIYLPPAGRMGLFAKKIPEMVFVQPWLVGYRLEFYFLRTGYFSPASLRHGDVAFICWGATSKLVLYKYMITTILHLLQLNAATSHFLCWTNWFSHWQQTAARWLIISTGNRYYLFTFFS